MVRFTNNFLIQKYMPSSTNWSLSHGASTSSDCDICTDNWKTYWLTDIFEEMIDWLKDSLDFVSKTKFSSTQIICMIFTKNRSGSDHGNLPIFRLLLWIKNCWLMARKSIWTFGILQDKKNSTHLALFTIGTVMRLYWYMILQTHIHLKR